MLHLWLYFSPLIMTQPSLLNCCMSAQSSVKRSISLWMHSSCLQCAISSLVNSACSHHHMQSLWGITQHCSQDMHGTVEKYTKPATCAALNGGGTHSG